MATNNKEIKVLINTPDYKKFIAEGVANHYCGLRPFWTDKVKYNIVGKRTNHMGSGKYWLPYDIIKFLLQLLFFKPNLIVVNPSLGLNALKRDYIFLRISKLFRKKVIVCFHGFNFNYVNAINHQNFVGQFNRADGFLVLSKKIKLTLINWGIDKPIYLFTTKVKNDLLKQFDINCRKRKINTITFLGRVTEEKGIFIALDVFEILSLKYPSLQFRVVGDGKDLDDAKKIVQNRQIKNVFFTGNLFGNDLINEFVNTDLYLFTSFHEGMPTSVLEAMAFGLPIITRPVGGLVDFFNSSMGTMIDSFEAKDFVSAIEKYIKEPSLCFRISKYNHNYAINNFLASNVAQKIEKSFREIINFDKISNNKHE